MHIKYGFLLLAFMWAFPALSQTQKWEMGLGLGGQYSYFLNTQGLDPGERLVPAAGYRFGFVSEGSIKPRLSISPKVSFAFTSTKVSNDSVDLLLNPVVLESNWHFKWYTQTRDLGVLFGPSVKFPLSVKEPFNRMMDVTLDLGLVYNRPLPNFTSAIEVWYSAGSINRFKSYPGTRSALLHQIVLSFQVRS